MAKPKNDKPAKGETKPVENETEKEERIETEPVQNTAGFVKNVIEQDGGDELHIEKIKSVEFKHELSARDRLTNSASAIVAGLLQVRTNVKKETLCKEALDIARELERQVGSEQGN